MKATIKNLENADVGQIELLEDVFGVKARRDILARMVNYQLAKRRSGNHKAKIVSEVSGLGNLGIGGIVIAQMSAVDGYGLVGCTHFITSLYTLVWLG